jgi:hypothetical protein
MWKIAADDVGKVAPAAVKLVLKKFGVKCSREVDSKGNTIMVPERFNDWWSRSKREFDDEVVKAIDQNGQLKNYLKGLINICRNNTVVLNPKHSGTYSPPDVNSFVSNLGLHKYTVPANYKSNSNSISMFANALRHTQMPQHTNVMHPMLGLYQPSNFYQVNPVSQFVPSIMGGSFYKKQTGGLFVDNSSNPANIAYNNSSTTLKAIFDKINSSLKEVGLTIHQQDKVRIQKALEQINEYETLLSKLSLVLNVLVQNARACGVNISNLNNIPTKTINLEDVKTMDDFKEFIRCYTRDVLRSMATNLNIQRGISFDLHTKVASTYLDDCANKLGKKELVDIE